MLKISIQDLMKEHHMTRRDAQRKIGVSDKLLVKLQNGTATRISLDMLGNIMTVFNLDLSQMDKFLIYTPSIGLTIMRAEEQKKEKVERMDAELKVLRDLRDNSTDEYYQEELTMQKQYRKTANILAEQFDGSKEMMGKQGIIATTWNGGVQTYEIGTIEGRMQLVEGSWIATGHNGDHWAIKDIIFKQTYTEDSNYQSFLIIV